ncbi:MAG: cell division protein ZapB [Candidatus Berkiella sp.]
MTSDLLLKLEQKVSHAVEVIELLRLQVEELEKENTVLKAEHEKWRRDLTSLLKRFDLIDGPATSTPNTAKEEEFMTV